MRQHYRLWAPYIQRSPGNLRIGQLKAALANQREVGVVGRIARQARQPALIERIFHLYRHTTWLAGMQQRSGRRPDQQVPPVSQAQAKINHRRLAIQGAGIQPTQLNEDRLAHQQAGIAEGTGIMVYLQTLHVTGRVSCLTNEGA